MFQVKGLILYFFLLILRILLDLSPNANYKRGGFSKTLPKKGLEFILSREDGIIAFNLSFLLLPTEVNPVLEKQGSKRNAFMAHDSGYIEMICTLSTKVITLYMQAFIVKVGVLSLKGAIVGCSICLKLAIFLAFNKQF